MDDAIAYGQRGILQHLKKTGAFRTNIGFVNLSATTCDVTVRLYSRNGADLGNPIDRYLCARRVEAGERCLQRGERHELRPRLRNCRGHHSRLLCLGLRLGRGQPERRPDDDPGDGRRWPVVAETRTPEGSSPAFLPYWGKTAARPEGGYDRHPLAYHCLDVAAVGEALMTAHHRLRRTVSDLLELPEDVATRLVRLLLALHDIGKFAPAFQAKRPECFDGPAPQWGGMALTSRRAGCSGT